MALKKEPGDIPDLGNLEFPEIDLDAIDLSGLDALELPDLDNIRFPDLDDIEFPEIDLGGGTGL